MHMLQLLWSWELNSTKKFLEGRSDIEVFLYIYGPSGEWKTHL